MWTTLLYIHTYIEIRDTYIRIYQELTINVPSKQTKLKFVILYISPTIRYNKYLLTLPIRQYDRIYLQP